MIVAGRNNIIRSFDRIDGNRDRVGAVIRQNFGRDVLFDFDGNRARRLVWGSVRLHPQRDIERADAFLGERKTNKAAPVFGHEIRRLRGGHI